MPRGPTQESKILNHLNEIGTISPLEALHLYKVRDLPKRISVLKARGTLITSLTSRDLSGSRYKRYYLL